MERATTLLNQSAALRSLMLLSGENGVGKSALAGRWLRSLEPKAYFPVCITQASLSGATRHPLERAQAASFHKWHRSGDSVQRECWRPWTFGYDFCISVSTR
jgi:hypothetical protein